MGFDLSATQSCFYIDLPKLNYFLSFVELKLFNKQDQVGSQTMSPSYFNQYTPHQIKDSCPISKDSNTQPQLNSIPFN